jgi:hypothetical protein
MTNKKFTANRQLIALIGSLMLASCATNLSEGGGEVELVTANQKEKCERVRLISTRAGAGPDKAGSALNKALNEASQAGANGFYILSQNLDWAIGATVTGEALRCDHL